MTIKILPLSKSIFYIKGFMTLILLLGRNIGISEGTYSSLYAITVYCKMNIYIYIYYFFVSLYYEFGFRCFFLSDYEML